MAYHHLMAYRDENPAVSAGLVAYVDLMTKRRLLSKHHAMIFQTETVHTSIVVVDSSIDISSSAVHITLLVVVM